METKKNLKRRTGYTLPFHNQQVLSWVGYLLQIIFYFTIIFPSLTSKEKLYISIPYLIIYIIYNYSFLSATAEEHIDALLPNNTVDSSLECRWCESKVNIYSKHCRSCNICRINFDHHCFFLNNCVTNSNYGRFFIGILFLFISSLFTTFLNIFIIMAAEIDNNSSFILAKNFYGFDFPKWIYYILHGICLIIMLGIEVFLIYLLGLHSLLIQRNITTFDVIQHWRLQSIQNETKKI